MNAALRLTTVDSAATPDVSHVFAAPNKVPGRGVLLAGLIDPVFLNEAGWDPAVSVLSPPAAHRLLGRPVCRVEQCSTTAPARSRVCAACQRRLHTGGLGVDQIEMLAPLTGWAKGPGLCAVTGCRREWASAQRGLCRAHVDQAATIGLDAAEFVGTRRPNRSTPAHLVGLSRVCSNAAITTASTASPINSGVAAPAARTGTSTSSVGG